MFSPRHQFIRIKRTGRLAILRAVCLGGILLATFCALAQKPTPDSSSSAPTIRSAAAALAAGDSKRADAELTAILRADPGDVHALNLLGILRAQQSRISEAEEFFKKAISIQPDFASAQAGLGLVYLQMGQDDLAIPPLQQALKLDPGREDAQRALVNIWRSQAHVAANSGDLEKALAVLISARKLSPDDADLQFDFGMVALRMSLFPDAVDAFKQTLRLRPDDASALYGLGRAQIALAKFDDAEQSFAHYIQLRPNDASGHYAWGFVLQALQRTVEARDEYEKSIAIQPQQTESYYQLGVIELDTGDLHAAARQFSRVLGRAPQHAGSLTGMGRIRFQEKDYDEAVSLLTRAVASNPRLREAHYYLGLADARLGRKEDSEKQLAIASQIEHEEVEKHQNVIRILNLDQLEAPDEKSNTSH